MSDDRPPHDRITTYVYDNSGPVVECRPLSPEEARALQERRAAGPARPRYAWEHDPAARAYRLTSPDGSVQAFRDNPTRYLCVEPDPESGQMRPVMERGHPVYLYLCREDREAR